MNNQDLEFVVIAGMAKTGTTLPLTLLDGHPELTVFPEELRFFHKSIHHKKASKAAKILLSEPNVKKLNLKKEFFSEDDYIKHGGTGFGKRDYSDLDFENFKNYIQNNFKDSDNAFDRYTKIIEAFKASMYSEINNNDNLIFVSKAPHNEKFIKEWEVMLGNNVKYILCTRTPTEHYLSLKKVNELTDKPKPLNVYNYINSVKTRLLFWDEFPKGRTYILDYDSLQRRPAQVMEEIAGFLNINFRDTMLKPTKFGVEWSGNSSRGIVKNKIYVNEHKAIELLEKRDIQAIEYSLSEVYVDNNWNKIVSNPNFIDRFKIKLNLTYFRFKISSTEIVRKLISSVTPKFIKNYVNKIRN